MTTNSAELLQQAISHHQVGNYLDAERVYLEIIRDNPRDPDANHNLGMLRVQQERIGEALSLLHIALEVDPARSQYWVSYLNTLISAGELDLAKELLELADQYDLERAPFASIRSRLNQQAALTEQPVASPTDNEINQLVSIFNSGDVKQAEISAQLFAKTYPQHPFGWKVMGAIAAQQGRYDDAESAMRQAVMLMPEEPEIHNNLGSVLMAQGRLEEAIECFNAAISLFPDYAEAYNNLGNAQMTLGLQEAAVASYGRALAIRPQYAEVHYNLGTLLQEMGNVYSAISSFSRALEIRPNFAEASYNMAGAFKGLKQLSTAVTCYKKAIEADPGYADAYYNLAITLKEAGRIDEAIASFRDAVRVKPDFANAYNNLGIALHEIGELEASTECYRQAIKIEPGTAVFHNNLGLVLHDYVPSDQVVSSYRKAIELDPNYPDAYNNLGATLYELDRHDEALECYEKAIALNPGLPHVYCNYGAVLRDLGRMDEAINTYVKAIELSPGFELAYHALLFCLNYHADLSGEQIYAYYQQYQNTFERPFITSWKPHSNDKNPGKRLKVGYVAATFHHHSCRHFLQPLLTNHDHETVEVYAYALMAKADAVTDVYKKHADHWIPTRGMSSEALAERIRADGIDILVDISGHTAGNCLQVFARKPAPVSLHWLDFGYTTGLTAIDYYLTDQFTIPEGSEHLFSEKPWRMPGTAYAYRPAEGMGEVSALPAKARGYITFGTLTRAVRINHHVIRTWSAILKQTPNARLVINSGNYQNPVLRQQLLDRFAEQGIAADRLDIGSNSPPWDVLRGIDIGLDCFPHNSGTTLFETLYMGIPFITLASRPSVGRLGASVLHGLGHPEWIADTEEDYIAKAVQLAHNLEELDNLRNGLRQTMEQSLLMDEKGFARTVEAAYRQMWQIWCEQ